MDLKHEEEACLVCVDDKLIKRKIYAIMSRFWVEKAMCRPEIVHCVGFMELQEITGRNTTQEGIQKRTETKNTNGNQNYKP